MSKRLSHIIACGLVTLVAGLSGCSVEPPLHLYRGLDIVFPEKPEVHMNVDVMWNYSFDVDWEVEWQYGWDFTDSIVFGGAIGYEKPVGYEVRRYYLNQTPGVPHTSVESFHMDDSTFFANYDFGYYDMLLWNSINTVDGVQSILIDESDLDNVTAETNRSMYSIPTRGKTDSRVTLPSFYEPEDLFGLYLRDIHISSDTADYDSYDAARGVYYKKLEGTLQPITYIYLPQLILYHNNGRINAVDGNAVITGMARRTSINTGITESDAVNVYFNDRMKKDVILDDGQHEGEKVDIIGGRIHTFGLCSTNPYNLTRSFVGDSQEHLIGINVQFYNGADTTLVFDVTDRVRQHFRGGVITMELDVDTLCIPRLSGGSGFDAQVADYEEEVHEFEM